MSDGPLGCHVCPRPATELHHLVTQSHLRKVSSLRSWTGGTFADLRSDERNMIPLCDQHHDRHHSCQEPLPLAALPDSVYVFATEVLGPDAAWSYLSRRYEGSDPRLDTLVSARSEAA
jgi:hypothetical protein